MPSLLKVMLGLVALAITLLLGFTGWYWSEYRITSWKTWGFRATHQIVLAHEGNLGARDIHFVLKPHENPGEAVKACARAFERELYYDHVRINCVAFGSVKDARMQANNPALKCERARATQWPYGKASNAEIKVNTDERCARAGTGTRRTLNSWS